jgi:quercetin dioxygenase-like cupin family protein
MDIKRIGSQPSAKGPAEWFTGMVRIDPLFQAPDPAFVQGASVTFEPGARTAWHTHPLGQTLVVTAGCGWAQRWGGPIEEIRPGDVIWFPPGEKHWHGAAPSTAMTHIAFRKSSTVRLSTGWNRSPTNNTRLDQGPQRKPQHNSMYKARAYSAGSATSPQA